MQQHTGVRAAAERESSTDRRNSSESSSLGKLLAAFSEAAVQHRQQTAVPTHCHLTDGDADEAELFDVDGDADVADYLT